MAARSSLSTLHARLNLPSSFTTSTLQRCLTDHTASTTDNNAGLANHGKYLLGHYVSNYIVSRYPRLPYKATTNALISYAGWKTLASVARDWGVTGTPRKEVLERPKVRRPERPGHAPTGDELEAIVQFSRVESGQTKVVTDTSRNYSDHAYADFVRSIIGAMQIHGSPEEVGSFIKHHILSRDVNLASSFQVTKPQRELSFLCRREGLETPVTRLIAETGRRSNAPVFIVGVYSGHDKLGEGQASSLREAEFLAQSNAMKAWYLFEDKTASLAIDEAVVKNFSPAMIDTGDIIV